MPLTTRAEIGVRLNDLTLDWPLALKRLKQDLDDDFWPDPIAFEDLVRGTDPIGRIRTIVDDFQAAPGASYDVPKANCAVRSSIYLNFPDRLVYQALVDVLIAALDSHLSPHLFSFRLKAADSPNIFRPAVGQFKQFEAAVASELAKRAGSYLIVTDISHYFESIRFREVDSEFDRLLRSTGLIHLKDAAKTLCKLLGRWSPYERAGLPQNMDASSFVGNVFLDRVDKNMEADGYRVFRYMDDIRIVVASEAEARRALVRLVRYLRELGLFINSAKTQIIAPQSDGMRRHCQPFDAEIGEMETLIGQKSKAAVDRVLPILTAKTRLLLRETGSDPRTLRYCLNRFRSLRRYRNVALGDIWDICDVVLERLLTDPSQTDTYCRFLRSALLTDGQRAEIVRIITSEPLVVYPWQAFHLWMLAIQIKLENSDLVIAARNRLGSDASDPGVAGAALFLGARGGDFDRDRIVERLPSCGEHFGQRCFFVALQETPIKSRNRAFGRLSKTILGKHLTTYLSELSTPRYCSEEECIGIEELPDAMPSTY